MHYWQSSAILLAGRVGEASAETAAISALMADTRAVPRPSIDLTTGSNAIGVGGRWLAGTCRFDLLDDDNSELEPEFESDPDWPLPGPVALMTRASKVWVWGNGGGGGMQSLCQEKKKKHSLQSTPEIPA